MKRRLGENIRKVRERIAAACQRAGRSRDDVLLVAVTKYVGVDVIRQLLEMGHVDIGESRVQALAKRAAMLDEGYQRQLRGPGTEPPPKPTWHMVGHLQRNKVKVVLPWVEMIHSVDSLRLAEDINTHAGKLGRQVPVLLQINVSSEKTRFGIAVGAAVHLVEQLATLPNLRLSGLMTMAPLIDDRDFVRNCFSRLRELLEDIRHEGVGPPDMRHLSMGMSQDFELAVEEGATIIRVGSALFEGIEQFAETSG